ncbi:MAG: DNA replication protein DnaC [Lachnospiraceae bacterium]|nr:DNA replication protein DnaC [Lachnospiraceae bacterium]
MALLPHQYDEVMRHYDQQRLQNQNIQQARLTEVYEKVTGYKALDDEIASASVAAGRARLLGDRTAIERLHEKIALLSKEKRQLLLTYGYPEDYLDPVYHCKACQDTGYIGSEKCQCLKQAIVDFIYAQSSIRGLLEKENFSTFSYDYYSTRPENGRPSPRANMEAVVSLCRQFICHFDQIEKNNLLFLGNAGVGKTFLSHCIAYELINSGRTVLYLTAFQLFDLLKQHAFQKEGSEPETSMEHLLGCDLLIIDDLGTELNNSFISSQLFLCMNERLLRKKATIISTNLSLKQLSQAYSERILSRIMEHYQILNIYGDDIRLKKALGK